jgi:hydrogenase-4 component B
MSTPWVWLLVPLAPLAGAALLPFWRDRLVPGLWLTCLPALATAAWPAPVLVMDYLWPAASWGGDDLITRGWLGFTALLWTCATLFAASSIGNDQHRLRFWLYWLITLSGNLLLVIAQDALSFYVGFAVMSLAAYGLVVHYGGPKPRSAGRIYLQLAIGGEMLLFAAFAMRSYAAGGALSFADWKTLPLDAPTLGLLLVGFGLKAGFWPLHVWLPLAHPAAPSPASAVLSGAMIKAGILGLWRTLPESDPLLHQWAAVLMPLGLFSIFYGTLIGLTSTQAKTALAYSSISQVGYLVVILALAWRHPQHASALAVLLVLFTAHHGLAKGALFLATGIHPLRPWYWLLLVFSALTIAGLPFSSGGAVKGELKHWFVESDFAYLSFWFTLATTGTILVLTHALWLLHKHDARTPPLPRTLPLTAPWVLLNAALLLMPWLWPLFREVLYQNLSWSKAWQAIWPMALAIALSLALLRLGWRVPDHWRQGRKLAPIVSMRLKRILQNPPIPAAKQAPDWQRWRKRERQWNRYWNSRDIVTLSAWLLTLFLLLSLIWSSGIE